MSVRVAINGFGRIGRNVFRAIYLRDDIDVVAINDIADPQAMEYLLRFDSIHGPFNESARLMEGHLFCKGRKIPVLHGREPGDVPWYDHGVDVVVEATGIYRSRRQLQSHLDAGADRVVLTVPPADEIDAVHLPGITEQPLDRRHRIISCGTSTANCTAAMIRVLNDAFGVESGFFTSVHAYTTEQSLIDTPSELDLRLSRAAVENIVPVRSWTQHAIEAEFPHLEGRFGGHKVNVPVPDVSCVDLVTTHPVQVSVADVQEVFRSAAASTLKGVLRFIEEPIVSSDIAGSTASCCFDSLATMVVGEQMVKTLGWYEQGGGLTHRIIEVIAQMQRKAAR